MALDWSDIRSKAATFAREYRGATREQADKHLFWRDFFDIFGVNVRKVGTYERHVANLPDDKRGFIDLIMPGVLLIEHKSAGLALGPAEEQAIRYWTALPASQQTRYILTCDFQNWRLVDLEHPGEPLVFRLNELSRHIGRFAFIVGREVRRFANQKPVNPKATRLLQDLHRQLEHDGYAGHELQLLLVRLLFLLFADDTNIWEKDKLWIDLQEETREDGSDFGAFLSQLFDVLNTPDGQNGTENKRQASLPEHFRDYPYINGRLFEERIGTAHFTGPLRQSLIDACAFDWGGVSPAVFGALFEGVIDKVARRAKGAHYTPEDAIFRLIGPLFLEELHDEFAALKARKDGGRRRALEAFHEKLASLTFFDPACGAGNFLVVTYRELREVEKCVIEELHPPGTRLPMGVDEISKVNVDQFYGIEIDEFPSQIAQVALWMADHIANVNLGDAYGRAFARVPLVTAPNIQKGNALIMDWKQVLSPDRCSYVLGNPPFAGQSYQSPEQRHEMRQVLREYGRSAGSLDYVAAWFLRAGRYARGSDVRIGFVATNSITQGEQVAQLWPFLFGKHDLEIAFAHRTFAWPSRAAVHCVIIGLDQRGNEPRAKRLFSYSTLRGAPVETHPEAIAAYLVGTSLETRHGIVTERRAPLAAPVIMRMGSKIVDGGNYIFTAAQRTRFLSDEPKAEPLLVPLIGSKELIQNGRRWILDLQDTPLAELRRFDGVSERVRRVRKFREASKKAGTRKLAATPLAFEVNTRPKERFLVVPEVSSERRNYVPMAWVDVPAVPTNLVQTIENASLYDFGVLTSAMHMAWLRQTGGRLKSDYRYSIGLVYNTFPWPEVGSGQRAKIEVLAQAVLDARAMDRNANASLADLYDPDFMPSALLKAHRALDAAVDKLYNARGFPDERARVEHLFRLYEALVQPTSAAPKRNRRQERRVARDDRMTGGST